MHTKPDPGSAKKREEIKDLAYIIKNDLEGKANTPSTPARIIPESEARIISQKLEYWDDGVSNFAAQASHDLRELQEKLKNPTRGNLPGIHADIKALIENQLMIEDINLAYRTGLGAVRNRFAGLLNALENEEEGKNANR